MPRRLIALPLAGLLAAVVAGPVLGADCLNESKPDGAGQKLVVLINPATGAPTFLGTNANGRFIGGFADVYLDVSTPGTLSAGDVLLIDDTFLVGNHSGKSVPGQSLAEGDLNVLPSILREANPAGAGKGIG